MVACPKTYFQSGNFPFASNKERGKPKARNDDVTSTTAEVQPTKCVGTTINHIYSVNEREKEISLYFPFHGHQRKNSLFVLPIYVLLQN